MADSPRLSPRPARTRFSYKAKNSQGTDSATVATVTLTFPVPSGLQVTLVDGKSKAALDPQDYRWIIEEDRTWYQDPNCSTNPAPAGCPGSGTGIVPAYGTNFHTSHMPVVAQGCTGDISCESGQTVLGVRGSLRRGQWRLPDRRRAKDSGNARARWFWIRPSATTSRSCRATRCDPGHAMGGAPSCSIRMVLGSL